MVVKPISRATSAMGHLNDHIEMDYFAVSLPDLLIWEDDPDKRNNLLCKYLIGLVELGLGNKAKSLKLFREALDEDLVNISVLKHLTKTHASLQFKYPVTSGMDVV